MRQTCVLAGVLVNKDHKVSNCIHAYETSVMLTQEMLKLEILKTRLYRIYQNYFDFMSLLNGF